MFAPHMCPEQVLKMVPREKLNGFQRSHDPLILGSVLHQITSSQRQAKSSQPKQYCHCLAYKTIDNDIDHIRTNVCENSFV